MSTKSAIKKVCEIVTTPDRMCHLLLSDVLLLLQRIGFFSGGKRDSDVKQYSRLEWGTQFKLYSNPDVRLYSRTISTTKTSPRYLNIPTISSTLPTFPNFLSTISHLHPPYNILQIKKGYPPVSSKTASPVKRALFRTRG